MIIANPFWQVRNRIVKLLYCTVPLFRCSRWCSVRWCTETRPLTPSPHSTWRSMPWQQRPTQRHSNMFVRWLPSHKHWNCFTLFTSDTLKQLLTSVLAALIWFGLPLQLSKLNGIKALTNITSADSNRSLISCLRIHQTNTALQRFYWKFPLNGLLKVN